VDLAGEAIHWDIPASYPVFGEDAFRTGTGVHASAVIKAKRRGDDWLANRIYSGVPASWFGRQQEIAIGHQSGESNIRYWLQHRGIDDDPSLVAAIFTRAKSVADLLSENEVLEVIKQHQELESQPKEPPSK
ncbi:MAG: 2-isopropylmalate synthase, partial [Proteobacteria bacterium]|nr:2-isopropylmalate synthase [Pseudomonadota bacterium]